MLLDFEKCLKPHMLPHFGFSEKGILKRRVSVNSEGCFDARYSLKRVISHKKDELSTRRFHDLRDCLVSIVSWDEDDDIMNSCGARVCGMTFSLRECESRSEWRQHPSHSDTHVRRLGHARCSKASPLCWTHKTTRRRQLVRSFRMSTSALSRTWKQSRAGSNAMFAGTRLNFTGMRLRAPCCRKKAF